MRIVWLGGVYSEATVRKYSAVNQAANRWSYGLLRSLQKMGTELFIIAHRPEQSWPKGELFPGKRNDIHSKFSSFNIKYINIKQIRPLLLSYQYSKVIKKVIKEIKPDVVLCYNPYPWNVAALKSISTQFRIPCVPVILDYDDPGEKWEIFKKTIWFADGYVFLSYWGYTYCPTHKPKLHFDGGNTYWFGDQNTYKDESKKRILYAGKYNHYAGIDIIRGLMDYIGENDSFELLLCGKGMSPDFIEQAKRYNNIKILGFLSYEQLHHYHLQADMYLNVRPPSIADNKMIFPSKIVNYLSYGKPVISSWTEGLSPEYADFLVVPKEENAKGFYREINDVGNWSRERYIEYKDKVKPWFSKRTWDMQAKRLTEWLTNEICNNKKVW